jgi:hypothetical protein
MAYYSGFQPVGIVLVFQDGNGRQMMVGSRQISNASIDMTQDLDKFALWGDSIARYAPTSLNLHIEADCYGGVMQHSEPATTPPAIEQRGIYLPNMSFRALPLPGEDAE